MKALNKALRGKTKICFMDFEGTQIEGQMIALGAFKCDLYGDGTTKKRYPGITTLVKSKDRVGYYVRQLTGITDWDLSHKGVAFSAAIEQLRRYVGPNPEDYIYCCYGNNDLRIINQSYLIDTDADLEFLRLIKRNFLDYASFLKRFVSDEHNNTISLGNALKMFGVNFVGVAHKPLDDAHNLMLLYDAVLNNHDILMRQFELTLTKSHSMPTPIRKLMDELEKKGQVNKEDFERFIKEAIS